MNEEIIFNDCMGVKQGEKVLIVYDKNKKKIAEGLYNKAKELGFDVREIEMPVGKENGEEPSEEIAKEMLDCDVLIITTTKSLSHTKSRRDATDKGIRIASMPNIIEDIMSRLDVDYEKMKERIDKMAGILKKGKSVRITTEIGTDITINIENVGIFTDYGIYTEKGEWGNLPAGEVAPFPKDTNGVFVVDASFAGVGKVDKPIKLTVKDNYVTSIEGGESAKKLLAIVSEHGKKGRNIAELGIGMNDKSKIIGNILEDEKVLGTAHIALGNNITYGGTVDVPLHLDGVFYNPTIFIDDKKIMDQGKLL